MQAIILAAGKGERLKELTDVTPKPMLKVGGTPLLTYIITSLRDIGITDFILVTKHLEGIIKDYYKDGSSFGVNIAYVTQNDKYGTGAAVQTAKESIKCDDIFLTFGDIVVPVTTYKGVKELYETKQADAAIGLNYIDDPYRGAAVISGNDGRITDIIEKPPKGDIPSNWNNAGVMAFNKIILDYVDRLEPSERDEYELTTSVAEMIKDNKKIYGYKQTDDEFWQDIGTPEDLVKAGELLTEYRK